MAGGGGDRGDEAEQAVCNFFFFFFFVLAGFSRTKAETEVDECCTRLELHLRMRGEGGEGGGEGAVSCFRSFKGQVRLHDFMPVDGRDGAWVVGRRQDNNKGDNQRVSATAIKAEKVSHRRVQKPTHNNNNNNNGGLLPRATRQQKQLSPAPLTCQAHSPWPSAADAADAAASSSHPPGGRRRWRALSLLQAERLQEDRPDQPVQAPQEPLPGQAASGLDAL